MLGVFQPTTRPGCGPTAGVRMGSAESPTTSSGSALPSRSGTSTTRSSRNAPFGLTNAEGNHGEDVKEYYLYLDSTPTHSYMKYLYKYPQREFPVPGSGSKRTGAGRWDFKRELPRLRGQPREDHPPAGLPGSPALRRLDAAVGEGCRGRWALLAGAVAE